MDLEKFQIVQPRIFIIKSSPIVLEAIYYILCNLEEKIKGATASYQ